jgi:hypothetical protein
LEFDEMINSTIGGYDSCIKTWRNLFY